MTDPDEWPEPARPAAVPHAELRAYLTQLRKQRGITQVEVAKAIGTSQSNVSNLESGEVAEPGLTTLARWAAALDLDLTVQVTEKTRHTFTIIA